MTPVTKYALIGGAAAVGLYLLWPKKVSVAPVIAIKDSPPPGGTTTTTTTPTTTTTVGPGQVAMDVTPSVAPDAVIDPVSKTLTAPTVTALDNWFDHYYVTSVVDSSLPNTRVLAATLIPSGQVPQDPNNVLSTAAVNLSKLGWNILVTKDVGDAGLLNDPSKLPSSMVLSATKDAAAMQDTFHKGGYIFRPATA